MTETSPEVPFRSAERMKFFTDAVVAIAMTLLILPLLENVNEIAAEGLGTADYLHENSDRLLTFVLSFVIIAVFWIGHERLFDRVGHWSSPLMVLNIAWMLTIVFLPVATALTGSLETDRAQVGLYIGTMLASSVVMWAMNVVVHRDPRTWDEGSDGPAAGSVRARALLAALFLVALVLGVAVPSINYFGLFVLFLTGPLERALRGRTAR